MKRRKGRQIDHIWQLVKYKGDACIYSRCSCGFRYNVSNTIKLPVVVKPDKFYHYCPHCGARKKWYTDNVIKIDRFSWE